MPFDVAGAKKAGYSDAEIADYLSKENSFDAAAAKKAGYTPVEIIHHLANKESPSAGIPDTPPPGSYTQQAPSPGFVDTAIGTGEAALSTVTGMTGGTVGMIGGALKGLAEQILSGKFGTPQAAKLVEEAAAGGAAALTYAPRTESGKAQAAAVGDVMQQLVPIAPLAGEAGLVSAALKNSAPAVAAVAEKAVAPVMDAAGKVAQGAKDLVNRVVPSGKTPTPGTMGSAGSAATDAATMRTANAEGLPVPLKLTEGMKTRDFAQQQFEHETGKNPDLGAPLRQRFSELNQKLSQNMDAFIDSTESVAPDNRSIGVAVDKALRARAARDKVEIRTLYKDAEKAGEMEAPVTLTSVIEHLNESVPEAEVANVLKAVRAKALKLGLAVEDANGELTARPVTLASGELFRKSINASTNAEPTNIRQAAILKTLYDAETQDLGGNLYKAARAARTRYGNNYENIGLVKGLLGQKRGTNDRAIALEGVLNKTVLEPSTSLDTLRHVRRLLQTEGENGKQAWKELQGGTLQHLKDEATKNVARDELKNPIFSASQFDKALVKLDKSGKLDFVFGKKGAEQLRTLNDVAKDVLVAVPNSVNHSNTAATLLAAMDLVVSSSVGIPAPVFSGMRLIGKGIKDAKLRARVKAALGD